MFVSANKMTGDILSGMSDDDLFLIFGPDIPKAHYFIAKKYLRMFFPGPSPVRRTSCSRLQKEARDQLQKERKKYDHHSLDSDNFNEDSYNEDNYNEDNINEDSKTDKDSEEEKKRQKDRDLRESSKIFGRVGTKSAGRGLTRWELAVNEAGYRVASEDRMLVFRRNELFERAKEEARRSYTFKRKSGSRTGVIEVEDSEKRRVSKKAREEVIEKKREEIKELDEKIKGGEQSMGKLRKMRRYEGLKRVSGEVEGMKRKRKQAKVELDVARKAATKAAYDANKRNGVKTYVPIKKVKRGPMDSFVQKTKRKEGACAFPDTPYATGFDEGMDIACYRGKRLV